MKILIRAAFDEGATVRLLNWLARENALILAQRPDLPLLYDSRVVYRREKVETWCDVLNTLAQGREDCDGLACYRAGELMARGFRALRKGEAGFKVANRLRPRSIPAEAFLRTRTQKGQPGLYHVVVRYWIDGREYRDDPSARLGMGGAVHPTILARRARPQGRAGRRRNRS